MEAVELKRLEMFLKKTFSLPTIKVKARPRKADSAEVYVDDEFIGIIFQDEDDEDDDKSYSFQMAILEFDLEDIEID